MVHQSGSADGTHRLCEGALCVAKGPPQGQAHTEKRSSLDSVQTAALICVA
jgi:hypothetical protein